jgi:hypothetical protein
MTIWKQKYEIIFEINESLFIKKILQFDEQEEKEEKELLEFALKNISIHLQLHLEGTPFKIERNVFIESKTQEAYVLAKWMYSRKITHYDWDCLDDAIRKTEIDFSKTSFEEVFKVLGMLYLLKEEEII